MDYNQPIQPVAVDTGMTSLWNNPFIYLIFFLFFGRGFGGFGGGVDQQLSNDFLYSNLSADNKQIQGTLQNIGNGLCAIQYENATQFGNVKAEIAECCCNTQKAILQSQYETEKGICALGYNLTNAIHADGEATRALINANTMQDLRDRLQSAEATLSNANQTQIINAQLAEILCKIPPQPVPAFIAPFPYGNNC